MTNIKSHEAVSTLIVSQGTDLRPNVALAVEEQPSIEHLAALKQKSDGDTTAKRRPGGHVELVE